MSAFSRRERLTLFLQGFVQRLRFDEISPVGAAGPWCWRRGVHMCRSIFGPIRRGESFLTPPGPPDRVRAIPHILKKHDGRRSPPTHAPGSYGPAALVPAPDPGAGALL